jgi:hypothetical protein
VSTSLRSMNFNTNSVANSCTVYPHAHEHEHEHKPWTWAMNIYIYIYIFIYIYCTSTAACTSTTSMKWQFSPRGISVNKQFKALALLSRKYKLKRCQKGFIAQEIQRFWCSRYAKDTLQKSHVRIFRIPTWTTDVTDQSTRG